MDLENLTVAELNALSDELDAQRAEIMALKRELHAVRVRKVAEEETAKKLGKNRRTVKATAAAVGVQGVK